MTLENTTPITVATESLTVSDTLNSDKLIATEALTLDELTPAAQQPNYTNKFQQALSELTDFDNPHILHYGQQAQQALTQVSDQMLAGVRNKDAGPAGEMLAEMVSVIKGFDIKKLDPNRSQSWWDKLLFRVKPLVKFQARYQVVTEQIENIAGDLEVKKEQLLHDITSLDKLYEANLAYFHDLEIYIDAGEKKLQELEQHTLVALASLAEQSGEMLDAQNLQDMRALRDDLERRVHDLRLTRQVAMQALPSIRLVQHNDKGLVGKINSTIVNTLPLWRQQLAQSIAIYRSRQAADTLKAATDLTNDLLKANAENLGQANQQARRQIERGVFDIEAIEIANKLLINSIEEGLKISEEGKASRRDAVVRLEKTETELKNTLTRAASHAKS